MKRINFKSLLMLLALPLAVSLTSCDKDNPLEDESPEVRLIDVENGTIMFDYDAVGRGSGQTVKIRANRNWTTTISGNGSTWININPSSGPANANYQDIEIFMKDENSTTGQRRADITFRPGTGKTATLTVIQSANEDGKEYKTVTELLALLGSSETYAVTEDFWVKGIVVNNPQLLNAGLGARSLFIVDDNNESGINIITPEGDVNHGLTRGDQVSVNANGMTLKYYENAIQGDGLPSANIQSLSSGNDIPYNTATIEELAQGKYQSMAVKVENVQFIEMHTGKPFVGQTRALEDRQGNILEVFTNSKAVSLAGENAPAGSGTMYGVVGKYRDDLQLYITATSDYADMTGTRFTSAYAPQIGTQTLPYVVNFNETSDYVATQVYNKNYEKFFGPDGNKWGTYFGTVSTTGPIEGAQSMQMRWYSSNSAEMGYTYTNFELQNLGSVTFKALNTNGLNVRVQHSTDRGATWSEGQLYTLATAAAEYTYQASPTGVNAIVKWTIEMPATAPTATSRVTLDDIQFLAPGQGPIPEFNVPQLTYSAPSTGGNLSINITGDVAWQTQVTAGNDYVNSVTPSGTGAGAAVVNLKANEDQTNTREVKVRIYTSAAAPTKEYTVTITQNKASSGGTTPSVGDIIYSETWGTFGSTNGVLITTYDKSGTTTFNAANVADITYSSTGATKYAKIYYGDNVTPSTGYEGASGGSNVLIPRGDRNDPVVISGIPTYGVSAITLSLAHRRGAADIPVKYTFNDAAGTTGNFTATSTTDPGEDYWVLYTFENVTVPAGATAVQLELSNTLGTTNVRLDDITITAAGN